MFSNNKGNETDFCESYKSEILGTASTQKERSFFSTLLKLLTIFILLAMIVGLSFYGYNYYINNKTTQSSALPPVSVQVSEDDLVVTLEDEEPEEASIETEPIAVVEDKEVLEEDLKVIEDKIKSAIAQSESKEEENGSNEVAKKAATEEVVPKKETVMEKETVIKKESVIKEEAVMKKEEAVETETTKLEVPTPSSPEAKYLEDLADLSKEIDKELNK